MVALAGVLALAFAGVALAATQTQTADIKFSKSKAGGATGVDAHFVIKDPGNTTPGQEGKPTVQIGRVDINFPAGMTFNDGALPACNQEQPGLIRLNCKRSLLAKGTAKIDGRGGFFNAIKSATLTAYNAKRGLRIIISSPGTVGLDDAVLKPRFQGSRLITDLPKALATVQAFLTDFRLTIPIKYGRLKGKRVAYAVLPKKCPKSGKFVVKTTFSLANGTKFTTRGTVNRCRK